MPYVVYWTRTSSELNPWVAKLVKSFEALYEITESLHDFRYEPIYVFSFEEALGYCFCFFGLLRVAA